MGRISGVRRNELMISIKYTVIEIAIRLGQSKVLACFCATLNAIETFDGFQQISGRKRVSRHCRRPENV
jgi:hypothetical protein